MSVHSRHVRLGHAHHAATLVVTGYPRDVHAGWLEPLTSYPGRVDVSVHIGPIDPATATTRLRRQLARLESGRRADADHGRLLDPHAEAATEDAYTLADRIARGEGRLFTVGLTLTVHAPTSEQLTDRVDEVRALAASLLIDARPTTYRALPGWVTGLPLGLDRLAQTRTFDTDALAAAFPLASADLPTHGAAGGPGGVLYGHNLGTRNLVFWDRFGCDNYNCVILGRSGAGKSYLVKLELLRSLYRGIDAHVIDPEDEYTRLAAVVGGVVVRPGAPGVHLNPLDLPITTRADGRRTAPRDALTRRALFLHTFLAVLLDEPLSAIDRAVLDTAITATYRAAGITDDPTTWTRPAPLLADLRATLTAHAEPDPAASGDGPCTDATSAGESERQAAARLAAMLHPFTDGAFNQLFTGPTTTRPDSHLIVWALRDLPEQLRPVGTLLALETIWTQVSDPSDRWPRLVVVDEAWLLMQQPAGAQFLLRAAKAGRKHWAGLTIATQDTADVLGTDLGRAVVTNAATQILLRQAPQAIDAVTTTFDLSAGERSFLLSAERGQALLSAGRHRVAFHALAADAEHDLITTDPRERAHHADEHDDHLVLIDADQDGP
ncbi:MAG: VirB4 family type IV secretion system protein [Pseudonocardia sp.]